jgi:hypothetical protein
MKLTEFYQRMNRRERLLAGLVVGVVALLVNLFIWNALLGAIGSARKELSDRRAARKTQTVFMKERDLWLKREAWLKKHQPALQSAGEASTLLDHVKEVAKKHNVLVVNPAIGSGQAAPSHQSVFASIETKSPWPALVGFLYDIQQPDDFIVFEDANLAIDSSDPTMMRGRFKIARWFAPANRK